MSFTNRPAEKEGLIESKHTSIAIFPPTTFSPLYSPEYTPVWLASQSSFGFRAEADLEGGPQSQSIPFDTDFFSRKCVPSMVLGTEAHR